MQPHTPSELVVALPVPGGRRVKIQAAITIVAVMVNAQMLAYSLACYIGRVIIGIGCVLVD